MICSPAQGFNLATGQHLVSDFLILLMPVILVENLMEMINNKNDYFFPNTYHAHPLKRCAYSLPPQSLQGENEIEGQT